MQYLKEDIRNRIRRAALEVFKQEGYAGASMRTIAHDAGIALGTVYKYFKNKEDLYKSLLEPVYDKILVHLRDFMNMDENPADKVMEFKNMILAIFEENNTELLILVDKSAGTKYESFKVEMVEVIHQILQKQLEYPLQLKNVKVNDPFIFYVIATSFFEGVCTLLRTQEDGARISQLTDQLVHIVFDGIEERVSHK